MRALPPKTFPLTVVIWDSDNLADEVRESSMEVALVLALYDKFKWACSEEELAILTAYKKHARFGKERCGVYC